MDYVENHASMKEVPTYKYYDNIEFAGNGFDEQLSERSGHNSQFIGNENALERVYENRLAAGPGRDIIHYEG